MFKNLFKALFLVITLVYLSTLGSSVPKDLSEQTVMNRPVEHGLSKGDIYFIPNQGQVDKQALFYSYTPKYTIWLTRDGLVFDQIQKQPDVKRRVSSLTFHGANPDPKVLPLSAFEHRVNYFIGRDESRWKTDIPTCAAVKYKDLYNHIDLKVYGRKGQIEYDWIIKPGGLVSDIHFEYRDAAGTDLDSEGNLVVQTEFGEFIHAHPIAFQKIGGEKKEIFAAFKRKSGNIFVIETGSYDSDQDLIIDPLIFSTYIGGNKDDYGKVVTTDSKGAVYVGGDTYSEDFPIKNPFQANMNGYANAIVCKIDAKGKRLIYSTYLGGSCNTHGYGIAVDTNGCAYVGGQTSCYDFPTKNPFQAEKKGFQDGFVTKFSREGNALVYSTFLGGTDSELGYGIAVDKTGCAWFTGMTHSKDFPLKNAFYDKNPDKFNVFVSKLNPDGKTLAVSSYIGGSKEDKAFRVAVDRKGSAYVVGYTESANLLIKKCFSG